MAPLAVLLSAWFALRLAGAAGAGPFDAWSESLRVALAVMFVFTGAAHFTRTRADLVRMVPPRFGNPGFWVTLTGLLEVAGAAGLLVPALARLAAICLALLLVALFPANVHAARAGLRIAGRKAMPVPARLALQLSWIAALAWVAWASPPGVLDGFAGTA